MTRGRPCRVGGRDTPQRPQNSGVDAPHSIYNSLEPLGAPIIPGDEKNSQGLEKNQPSPGYATHATQLKLIWNSTAASQAISTGKIEDIQRRSPCCTSTDHSSGMREWNLTSNEHRMVFEFIGDTGGFIKARRSAFLWDNLLLERCKRPNYHRNTTETAVHNSVFLKLGDPKATNLVAILGQPLGVTHSASPENLRVCSRSSAPRAFPWRFRHTQRDKGPGLERLDVERTHPRTGEKHGKTTNQSMIFFPFDSHIWWLNHVKNAHVCL